MSSTVYGTHSTRNTFTQLKWSNVILHISVVTIELTNTQADTYNRHSSVTATVSQLQWENVEERRSKACLIKIIHSGKTLLCIQSDPCLTIQPPDTTMHWTSLPDSDP